MTKLLPLMAASVTNWQEVTNTIYINTIGEDVNMKLNRNNNVTVVRIPRNKIPLNNPIKFF